MSAWINSILTRLTTLEAEVTSLRDRLQQVELGQALYLFPSSNYLKFSNGDELFWVIGEEPGVLVAGETGLLPVHHRHRAAIAGNGFRLAAVQAPGARFVPPDGGDVIHTVAQLMDALEKSAGGLLRDPRRFRFVGMRPTGTGRMVASLSLLDPSHVE